LIKFYEFYKEYFKNVREEIKTDALKPIEKYLISKLNKITKEYIRLMEDLVLNEAVLLLFEFFKEIEEYKEYISQESLDYLLTQLLNLFNPFIPHLTEELWSKYNEELLYYKEIKEKEVDEEIIQGFEYILKVIEDIKSIEKLVKNYNKIYLIVADEWKSQILEEIKNNRGDKTLIKKLIEKYPEHKEIIPKIYKSILKELSYYEKRMKINEIKYLNDFKELIEKEFGKEVTIKTDAEMSSQKISLPLKPAIVLE